MRQGAKVDVCLRFNNERIHAEDVDKQTGKKKIMIIMDWII